MAGVGEASSAPKAKQTSMDAFLKPKKGIVYFFLLENRWFRIVAGIEFGMIVEFSCFKESAALFFVLKLRALSASRYLTCAAVGSARHACIPAWMPF
eukprot:2653351-Rhodomonas_salina.1